MTFLHWHNEHNSIFLDKASAIDDLPHVFPQNFKHNAFLTNFHCDNLFVCKTPIYSKNVVVLYHLICDCDMN